MKNQTFEGYKNSMLGFHGSNNDGCTWIKIDEKDKDKYEHLTFTKLDKDGELEVKQVK